MCEVKEIKIISVIKVIEESCKWLSPDFARKEFWAPRRSVIYIIYESSKMHRQFGVIIIKNLRQFLSFMK